MDFKIFYKKLLNFVSMNFLRYLLTLLREGVAEASETPTTFDSQQQNSSWISQNPIETHARVHIFYAGPPQDTLICHS